MAGLSFIKYHYDRQVKHKSLSVQVKLPLLKMYNVRSLDKQKDKSWMKYVLKCMSNSRYKHKNFLSAVETSI